jgi:hypothetical protein
VKLLSKQGQWQEQHTMQSSLRRLGYRKVSQGSSTKPTPKPESLERRSKEVSQVLDPVSPVEDLEDRNIDRLVPPNIMRLTQHFHNLIYIRDFYIGIGQQPPEWTKAEMQRAELALLDELDLEHGQGGRLRRDDETR